MCTENYHWHHDYIRLAWDSGFAFNVHKIKVNQDWSSIGLLDIDRVVRDRDVAILEKHMLTILNYSLDEDHTRILDPTFVKIFQLSQLSVQYLQFCKRYLDNTVVLLKKELSKHKEENTDLKNSVEELKTEVCNLKKKVKELKQSVQVQQPQTIENALSTSFKCTICAKLFVSEDFLISHIKRRHEVDSNPFQTETDRLQLEIKELKERLNSTEKYIQGDHNTKAEESQESIPNNDDVLKDASHVKDLKDKFDNLKQFVERELRVLRDEKHYQEKYEKWFDVVFQRLDNSRRELQEKEDRLIAIADEDRLNRKDSSTQTVAESYVETETMTDEVPYNASEEQLEPKSAQPVVIEVDMKKIQNDIKINTETHLDQIQGALEKKLSGGLEQIQTQMNSFWKKLSDMELEKSQANVNSVQLPRNARNIMYSDLNIDKKQCSPSTSSASSSESLEKPEIKVIQPMPAPRITKKFPAIIQSKPKETTAILPVKTTTIVKPKSTKRFQQKFSEDTSSDEVFEIVKSPVRVSSARETAKYDSVDVAAPKSKSAIKPAKTQYKVETESSSSETEAETFNEEPQVKPSNTSTLGERSVTSLKHMVKDRDVMKGLKHELHDIVNMRLKEIGISPNWSGIPEKSFQKAILVVRHQSEMSKKKYSNYSKAREVILKLLNETVRKGKKPKKQDPIERKKKEKVLVIKQPVAKKPTKREKNPAKLVDTTQVIDLNSEDSTTKPNTSRKESAEKENVRELPTSNVQEKLFASATPIKKKVLFDLEDSSSTSNLNISNMNILQNQQNNSEEKAVTVTSPLKRQNSKEANIVQVTAQRSQKVLKIDDGGSTTSLASSMTEAQKTQSKPAETKMQNFTKEDTSDWDISDILT